MIHIICKTLSFKLLEKYRKITLLQHKTDQISNRKRHEHYLFLRLMYSRCLVQYESMFI
jgi:hypothetical protein